MSRRPTATSRPGRKKVTARARHAFARVEDAIEAIRAGRMIIVVDDEDRENEGDLTIAASAVTPDVINFMARHGRGLVCMPMTGARLQELEVPLMVTQNTARFETAFCVSIEAGTARARASAADRAASSRRTVGPPRRPTAASAHVPASRDGVLVAPARPGRVGMARIAGFTPGVLRIMNGDGSCQVPAGPLLQTPRDPDDHDRGSDQMRMRTSAWCGKWARPTCRRAAAFACSSA
jgi:3,4-dihydroxy-2-butanone 4-phosphate synthase